MSRRRPARDRHLRVVDPELVREIVPPTVDAAKVVAFDAPPPEIDPERRYAHMRFTAETLAVAAAAGVDLQSRPLFPCAGYAAGCSCWVCDRRQQWTDAIREALLIDGVAFDRATDLAAARAAKYAGRLEHPVTELEPLPSTRRRRARRRAA